MNEEQNTTPTTPPALPTGPQKRIAALSTRGDSVWRISEPVLLWMIENGDEELQKKAIMTHMAWESEQGWFIEWGNSTRYFQLAELACRDLHKFQEAIKVLPVENEGMDRIIKLALMTGEQFNRPTGIKPTNMLKWKRKKHGRGRKR